MTRKKMKELMKIKEQIHSDMTVIAESQTEIVSGPEFSLSLEQCEKYFPKIEYRIQRIIRLHFAKVSDEEAARLLQVTADKVQGLYQRHLKLILTLMEAEQ